MPVISFFFGIYIRMYHADHGPAHFHVEYQGHEALVAIETDEVLAGKLPGRALRIVRDWCEEHREELRANWQRAQNLEPLERIPGADDD
jgi:hypothetical protein